MFSHSWGAKGKMTIFLLLQQESLDKLSWLKKCYSFKFTWRTLQKLSCEHGMAGYDKACNFPSISTTESTACIWWNWAVSLYHWDGHVVDLGGATPSSGKVCTDAYLHVDIPTACSWFTIIKCGVQIIGIISYFTKHWVPVELLFKWQIWERVRYFWCRGVSPILSPGRH